MKSKQDLINEKRDIENQIRELQDRLRIINTKMVRTRWEDILDVPNIQ